MMPPPPKAKASAFDHVSWCTSAIRANYILLGQLGLPQGKERASRGGSATFEGPLAAECKLYYNGMLHTAKEVAMLFRSKKNLQDNAYSAYKDLSSRLVEPLVDKYGPVIWCASGESPVTRLHSKYYPEYLRYDQPGERRRIVLHTYCWIVQGALRELSKKSSTLSDVHNEDDLSLESSTHHTALDDEHKDTDDEDEDTPLSQLLRDRTATCDSSLSRGEPTRSDDASVTSMARPVVPIAELLPEPTHYFHKGTVASDSSPRYHRSQRKRRQSEYQESEIGSSKSSTHCKRRQRCETDGDCEINSDSIPSPVDGEVTSEQSLSDIDPRGTVETSPSAMQPLLAQTAPLSIQRPSLVIALKLPRPNILPQCLQTLRSRLAWRLIEDMASGMHDPNVEHLTCMIEAIGELSTTANLRLLDMYHHDHYEQRVALSHWVECLNHVTTFYRTTGFHGNLSTRNEFLENANDDYATDLDIVLIRQRAKLDEWRLERGVDNEGWFVEVAAMLFKLASWSTATKAAKIDSMIIKFSRELMAWFD